MFAFFGAGIIAAGARSTEFEVWLHNAGTSSKLRNRLSHFQSFHHC